MIVTQSSLFNFSISKRHILCDCWVERKPAEHWGYSQWEDEEKLEFNGGTLPPKGEAVRIVHAVHWYNILALGEPWSTHPLTQCRLVQQHALLPNCSRICVITKVWNFFQGSSLQAAFNHKGLQSHVMDHGLGAHVCWLAFIFKKKKRRSVTAEPLGN